MCRRVTLKKRLAFGAAGALALGLAAWGTSLSFDWSPEPKQALEEPVQGDAHDDFTSIEEAQRDSANVVDYKLLDERLQRLIQDKGMVGLAVGVVEGGKIRFLKGYGETVAGSGDPVTANTIFRWASVSKGVAADMVVKLAEQNKVQMYAPVAKYAPSLRLPGGNEHKATVSDLLSHRLGLFGHANDSKLEDGGDARLLRANLATLNAICPPSSCHAYQNVAYDAASEIVERVTGKPYSQVVREQMFLPLGMTTASMTREALLTSQSWARPHRGGKTSKPVEVTDSYYRVPAAGGVNSSIRDLAIWMIAQMGEEPEVLSPRVLANVQSPRANTPGEMGRKRKFRERLNKATYGLGWRIYDYAGNTAVGHRGGVTGYRSLLMFDPVKNSGVVALWNSSSAKPGAIEFEVMDMIYRLPRKDWLELDKSIPGETSQPQEMLKES